MSTMLAAASVRLTQAKPDTLRPTGRLLDQYDGRGTSAYFAVRLLLVNPDMAQYVPPRPHQDQPVVRVVFALSSSTSRVVRRE